MKYWKQIYKAVANKNNKTNRQIKSDIIKIVDQYPCKKCKHHFLTYVDAKQKITFGDIQTYQHDLYKYNNKNKKNKNNINKKCSYF